MRMRGVFAVAAAAVLLLVSGCGSAEKAAAGHAGSVDQGSVDRGASVALTSDNFVDTVTKAVLEAGSTHVKMNLGAEGRSVDASGDVRTGDDPADTEMAMTMAVPGMGDMEMRLVEQVFYIKMGAMTQNKFAKLDLTDPDNPMGKTFGEMAGKFDPSKSLQNLNGAITSFKKSGAPEEIDGVQAQPYTVTVDTSKMAEHGGLGGNAAAMPDELTYKFWVGSDDLPRKLTSHVSGADIDVTFTKWGEDVDVQAPPAGQITKKDPFSAMPSQMPSS